MEKMNSTSDNNYTPISTTAKLTAYLRTKTDITYAKEIADFCGAEEAFKKLYTNQEYSPWMAAMLEIRYKSLSIILDKEIKKRNIEQVLEIAAGIATRGLVISENPNITYVETDLSDLIVEKKKFLNSLDPILCNRPNYILTPLDSTNKEDFQKVSKLFGKGEVIVINEGLLPYLSVKEKRVVAKNIHTFLERHGGIWITPDLSNSDKMKKIFEIFPRAETTTNKLDDITKRNMKSNSIEGGKEGAMKFYEDAGFTISEYKATDLVDDLKSLSEIKNKEKAHRLMEALSLSGVWVLEAIK